MANFEWHLVSKIESFLFADSSSNATITYKNMFTLKFRLLLGLLIVVINTGLNAIEFNLFTIVPSSVFIISASWAIVLLVVNEFVKYYDIRYSDSNSYKY